MMESTTSFQRNVIKMYKDQGNAGVTNDVTKAAPTRVVLRNIENVPRRTTLKREAKSKTQLVPQNVCQPKENTQSVAAVEIEDEMNISSINLNKIKDIDAEDADNPILSTEYVKDIYRYLRKIEVGLLPGDYMSNQSEISEKMRSILIDWLIQVHSKFNLLQETLYLTVCNLDRYLSKKSITRQELQLVGVTAMLLASKYEEMYAPELSDFVYITDNAYSKEKIKAMEQKMMKALEYDFSNPLCIHFLRRNSKAGEVDAKKHTLAKYFMELCLINYKLTLILPSKIAAASLYLSMHIIDSSEWTETLQFYSEYSKEELLPVVCDIAALSLSAESVKYQAVKTKYASRKLMGISKSEVLRGTLVKALATLAKR